MKIRISSKISRGIFKLFGVDYLVHIRGGLGNQMFQYAFGVSLYQSTGRKIYYSYDCFSHEGWVLNKYFNVTKCFLLNKYLAMFFRKIAYISGCYYQVHTDLSYNVNMLDAKRYSVLNGYFPSFKYFEKHSTLINHEFKFRKSVNFSGAFEKKDLIKEFTAVHLRFGDYLNENNKMFIGICTKEYYITAINYIKKNQGEGKFLVFSDDFDLARKAFPKSSDVYYIDDFNLNRTESWVDMQIMGLCKNVIMANSTYSWWAMKMGPLNRGEGICIAPNEVLRSDVYYSPIEDFIPEGVIKIDSEGNIY